MSSRLFRMFEPNPLPMFIMANVVPGAVLVLVVFDMFQQLMDDMYAFSDAHSRHLPLPACQTTRRATPMAELRQ